MRFMQSLMALLIWNGIVFGNIGESLLDLYEQIPRAIDRIEEEKCFLKPEKVIFSESQIYVQDTWGNLITFPMVCVTQTGIFVPLGSRPTRTTLWICTKCKRGHYYQPTVCETDGCGGRDFIVRYQ